MSTTTKLSDLFGSMVFNEDTMKERLSSASYERGRSALQTERLWISPPPMRSPRP